MTATEFAFLALGLILGVVSGAALVEVLRARPPVPRDVRLTIAPDAIPRRRAATLSDDAFATAIPQPARGGPADRRLLDAPHPTTDLERRTTVRSGVSAMDLPSGSTAAGPFPGRILEPPFRLADPPFRPGPNASLYPDIGDRGTDPILAVLRQGDVSASVPSRDDWGDPRAFMGSEPIRGAVAVLERPIAFATAAESDGAADGGGATSGGGVPSLDATATDQCAAERRIAAERCGLAVRARTGAAEAADAARAAQRVYDEHLARADAATEMADPRAVRRAKEAAQARFRQTYDGAQTTDDAEAAARDWLVDINDINLAARAATASAKRERASASAVAATLERLSLEADAARIAAETAEAACLTARQALAECDERSAAGIAPPPRLPSWSDGPEPPGAGGEDEEPLAVALHAGDTPTIFRLVRGDRSALIALVERLSAGDTAARRRWQASLTGLVDAIVSVSIEAGALHFPAGHPFWGMFTVVQDREIAQALSSLGHRFDGLGGYIDDRVPSQRDLSLALGYAGIDPMRMRPWPTDVEMAALYEHVTVAADEHLAATAGDLSLAELVALLGRRADSLADLWNEWGQVRPMLLEGA